MFAWLFVISILFLVCVILPMVVSTIAVVLHRKGLVGRVPIAITAAIVIVQTILAWTGFFFWTAYQVSQNNLNLDLTTQMATQAWWGDTFAVYMGATPMILICSSALLVYALMSKDKAEKNSDLKT